jgi:hypothetical protein
VIGSLTEVGDASRDAVFGSVADLGTTETKVSAVLGITMVLHESLYLGGEYYLGHLSDGSEVRVRPNVDLLDDVPEIGRWPGPVFVELYVRSDAGQVAEDQLFIAGFARIVRDR